MAQKAKTNRKSLFGERVLSALVVVSCSAFLMAESASAQNKKLQGKASVSYERNQSDNILQAVENQSGAANILGTQFDIKADSRRYQVTALGDIQYIEYSQSSLDAEVVGEFTLDARAPLLNDRVTFFLEDAYNQRRSNPLLANSPNNREGFNSLEAGLESTLPLGNRTALALTGTYGAQRFEDSEEVNQDYVTVEAALNRTLARGSQIGLQIQSTEFQFRNDLPEYKIESALVTYEREFLKGGAVLRAGRNRLTSVNSTQTGPQYFLSWGRPIGKRSTFSLSYEQEFSDAGDAFALTGGGDIGISGPRDTPLTTSALTQERFSTSYGIQLARTSIGINVSVFTQDFATDARFNNDSFSAQLGITRELSPTTSASFNFDRLDRDFDLFGDSYEESTFTLSLGRQLGNRASLQLGAQHANRRGTDPFNATSFSLRIRYALIT